MLDMIGDASRISGLQGKQAIPVVGLMPTLSGLSIVMDLPYHML